MISLAEALPEQINRVREVQDRYKALRGMPNVMVEPTIALMEVDIRAGVQASAEGDVVAMLRANEALKGWEA